MRNQDILPDLSVCVVTYRPDLVALKQTLESLCAAIDLLPNSTAEIMIVDNSPTDKLSTWLREIFPKRNFILHRCHRNLGFGRANNIALERLGTFHLVLNPDVEMAPDCLLNALAFLRDSPDCGLLTPYALGAEGNRQYLCKQFPTLVDLFLRGFAPSFLRRLFRYRLDRYQMAEMPANKIFWDPPIVSGCFMLFRGEIFKSLNGFDPDYFLYFEDFDLSLRASKVARIAFVPDARIRHGGGDAGRKGAWHIFQFAKSAATFYRKFGIKVA